MQNYTHIVFDWHGVIDTITFEKPLQRISQATGIPSDTIMAQIQDVWLEFDKGNIFYGEASVVLQERLGLSETLCADIYDHIMTIDYDEKLLQMFPELSPLYSLSILSDCPSEKTEEIKRTADLSCFEQSYFSSDHGITKHQDIFFIKLLDDLGVQKTTYQQVLFVDDSPYNISKAKHLGLSTCEFATVDDLTTILDNAFQ